MSLPIQTLMQSLLFAKYNPRQDILDYMQTIGGMLCIPSPETLRTASNGTGVAVEGSIIGYMQDLTGLRNLTQSTTSSKPKLVKVGGNWALEFDGSNDIMTVDTPIDITGGSTLIVANSFSLTSAWQCVSSTGRDGSTGTRISSSGTGTLNGVVRVLGSGPVMISNTNVTGSNGVRTLRHDKDSLTVELRNNGVLDAQSAVSLPSSVSTQNRIAIGGLPDWRDHYQGNVFAMAYAPIPIPNDKLIVIERYFASLCGVSI